MRYDEIPAAFQVARAEFGPVALERCSCGSLKPQGARCPHAEPQGEAVPLFTPAPNVMPGQLGLAIQPTRECSHPGCHETGPRMFCEAHRF